MVKTAEMVGRRAVEKASGFSVTCSRLSQYLKERGGLADLALGFSPAAGAPLADARGKAEVVRTMNLLPSMEPAAGGDDDSPAAVGTKDPAALSMELFPQRASFGYSDEKKADLIREAQRGQMTIFYGGKVVVFDNFPADKARELMTTAGKGCPASAQHLRAEQPVLAPALPQQPSFPLPVLQNLAAAVAVFGLNSEAKSIAAAATTTAPVLPPAVTAREAAPQKPTQPRASDLPIARRVSLHRFLEKRKDRISAKAPYPVCGSPVSSSPSPAKPQETRQWLGLAPHVVGPEDLHV